jgi:hypothetical protein
MMADLLDNKLLMVVTRLKPPGLKLKGLQPYSAIELFGWPDDR